MKRRQGSRAAHIPARRRPACLPRVALPEAGGRVLWDENTTLSM